MKRNDRGDWTQDRTATGLTWRKVLVYLLCEALVLQPLAVFADPVAANGATTVYQAPNGVPVVDIAKPNAAGLSHNRFNSYDVDTRGIVLNNGDPSQLTRQSQLAGQVTANMNLDKEAKVILNEVVRPGRSNLEGYTEVLGGSANVVIANPYGITCKGCGFINTPNVTLTTGVPRFGSTGELTGFRVDSGDILITGAGLDATKPDYLSLVARSLYLDGKVNAKDLSIATGSNEWDYASRTASATGAASGTAPTYALDSTLLGGMYADRIRIQATETGVGVRMLGDAAASADDFTLDTAGRIVLLGRLSAQRDLHVGSTATDSDAVSLGDASFSAKNDINISAAGGLVINGGVITADNNLGVVAGTLTDRASTATLTDNNQRYAAGTINVSATGAMALDGVSWGAGTDFLAAAGSFAAGSGGTMVYAIGAFNLIAVNDLDLGAGVFRAGQGMGLSAGGQFKALAGQQGIQATAGDITLRAGGGFDNAAIISAEAGGITIRSNGAINNSGVLHAAGDMNIADFSGGATQVITNAGQVLSDGALLIKATSVSNQTSAVMQAATGTTLAAISLNNDGTFTVSTEAGKDGGLTVSTLTNTGVLQSAATLSVDVSAALTNSGKLLAADGLEIMAGSNATTITNSGDGIMQAGNVLSFSGANAMLQSLNGASLIGNSASLTLGSLENAGILQTEAGMNLAIGNAFTNSGTLLAKGVLTAGAGSLNNSGGMQADQGSTINIAGVLTNSGKLIASSAAAYGAALTAVTLSNMAGGSIQSAQNLQINIGGSSVTNAGKLIATGDMTLTSTGSGLTFTNQNGAYLQSGSNSGDVLTVNGNNVSMNSNGGGNLLGNAITLNLSGLSNYGVIQGGSGTSSISASGGIDNHGILHSSGSLNLSGAWLNNYAQASAANDLTLSFSGNIYNDQALFAGSFLKSNYSASFTNASNGTLNSNGSIDVAASTFVNNNDITAQGNITITAATFQNDVAGDLTRAWGGKSYTGGDVSDGSNIYGEYGGGCSCNKEYFHYYHLWTQTEYFVNGNPTTLDRPKIMGVGGGSLVTIKGFNAGTNRGGIISGNNVTLAGNGFSSFINDDLSLLKRDGRDTWDNLVFWYGVPGSAISSNQGRVNDAQVDGTPWVDQTFGAGIFANGGNISVSGVLSVVNKSGTQKGGSVSGAGSSASGATGATGVIGTTTVSGAPAVNFGGLVIELPVSPYGYFVQPLNPDAKYLVELNPLFSAGSSYLGSNYLADHLGYDPDTMMRRLGDAAYETYLVREQLVARTGNNILQGYASETQQMQALMDAAASQMAGLGLKFGSALDAKQIAGLDQDIVWMVETEVAGQKVLAPVVYLSQATRDSIVTGAVIAASHDINMDVGSLTNAGGTISAGNTLTVIAKDDIRNTGGTISASNMALVSTDGKVINETTVTRAGTKDNYEDVAGKTGAITAKNNLVISGQKGVDIVGATVSAGESAVLHSESGDINIQSLVLEKKTTTEKQERGLFFSSSEKTVETSQQRLASSVTVGDGKNADAQLTLLADKGNVNLLSAEVASSGGINVKAKDINIAALDLESSKTKTSSSSGISVSGGAMTIGLSSSSSAVKSSTAVGSSLSAGGALNMMADGDIVLEGGSYKAKTVSLDATNVITKAAKNTYSSSSSSASAGVTMGNGSIGAGSQSASGSLDVTQHANAQIVAADGISIAARKTVDIGGLDAVVSNKAPAPTAASVEAAGAAEDLPATKSKAAVPGFDVNALKAAVAAGTAGTFIAGAGHDGIGTGAAMADMTQAATGQLAITGENIVSTKYKDEYRKTSESAGTYVGIGTQSQSSEKGSSAGIGLSVSSSYSKENASEKRDSINNLSADSIALEGKKGIDLKGVAIAGSSSVSLKSDGDINISAAEVEKQHTLESHSMHLDVGTTVSAGEDKGPFNVTGPLEVQATLGFDVQTHSLNESSKGHVDSTLSSDGALSIESGKGNVTWTGVTASADTLDIKANNFNSAAYQDSATISESSNSLGINLSVGTDIGKMAQSVFQGNGSKSTTLQRSSTDEIGNTMVARSVNLDVKDNVTLVGGNLVADDVRIKANTVDIKAEKSTLDEHKTEVGVSLVMDGSAAFMGNKAWGSLDSMKAAPESGTSQSSDHAERTGDGRVNNGKAVSDELLSGRTGLSIASSETTTKSESYRNAALQFNQLAIDTTAPAGSTRGDGHVDIGGASLLGSGAGSSIGITTGELKTTKYVDKTEVTSHDNSTFIGVAVEGHSAIADTVNHEKTLQDKKAQGMTLDEGWVAAQRAADASNMAMGDAVGGSVAATVRNIDTKTHSISTSENISYLNAENISIKTTQGNLALNGVEFNAPPVYNEKTGAMEKATGPRAKNISLDSAKDISLTAAKSTYSETSTTLTNDFNVTGSGSISGSGSGVGVDVGYNGSIDNESLNRTSYANASLSADNVSIKSKNLSLTGANVSGGNVKVDVEKDISITSVQDTQTQSTTRGNWGGSVGLNTTSVVSVNGQGGGGDSHDNYAKTAQQSGITAEKNLDVTAGGNLTLTGAKLASAGTGSVKVKGDLTVNKLEDFHEKDGLFAGASGGINQGGVNAGINLEKVDQIHNATTQNSTISGVSLDVAGKTQGDNLKADGGLQTQATTVLKDEKIAGVYVNGTGVVTKSGIKKVATAATVVSKTVADVVLPAKPLPAKKEGEVAAAPAIVKKANDDAAQPGKQKEAVAPTETASAKSVTPTAKQSQYDTNVVIVTRAKDGSIDRTVQDSANDLAGKHPENTVVLVEKEGGGFENPEALKAAKGKVRVNVVGHGSDLKGEETRVAGLVHEVDKATDASTTIEKVGLVACGGCSKGDEKSLGESVALQLHEKGIDTVVAERSGGLKVNQDGTKSAFDGEGKQSTKTKYSVVDGVVKTATDPAKRQEAVKLNAGRYLGKKEEEAAAAAAAPPVAAALPAAVPLFFANELTVPADLRGQQVHFGEGTRAHEVSATTMTKEEFAAYENETLGEHAGGAGLSMSVGGVEAQVKLSRRGSFSVSAPVDGGDVSVVRVSSLMTSQTVAEKPSGDIDKPTMIKAKELKYEKQGAPNAVKSTAIELAYEGSKGLAVKSVINAEGISGNGVSEPQIKEATKDGTAKQTSALKAEGAAVWYAPAKYSANQVSSSGTARPEAVHHSEPMAVTLQNLAAEATGLLPLRERPTLFLVTSIPRQACNNCGATLAIHNHPKSIVSVESSTVSQSGPKPGPLQLDDRILMPGAAVTSSSSAPVKPSEPMVRGENVASVTKAVPHKKRSDEEELAEVNAARRFHHVAKSKKPADDIVMEEEAAPRPKSSRPAQGQPPVIKKNRVEDEQD